ncbi:hypothetical protein [Cellulomonas timonensis]|nr:hypothetical protein [Cellulomonas timonensis]
MRTLTTALEVGGAVLVIAGVAMLSGALALIVAGAAALVFSWRLAA